MNLYKVKLNDNDFFMTRSMDNSIGLLWQTEKEARAEIEKKSETKPYAIVMGNDEVISYGIIIGFITERKLIK